MSVPVIDRNRGFSMIEVLMVLAIAGMLMLVAIPNFQDFMKDRQATQVINQLLRAVYFTRTQAIEKAAHVTLCQSSDGIACGGEWGDGYVVFLDPNRNATVDAGEEILLHRGRFENDSQVTWHGSGGIDSHLRMTPQGYTDNIFGTFIYCPSGDDAHFSRGLTINRAGRAYLREDSDSNGIPEYGGGGILFVRRFDFWGALKGGKDAGWFVLRR